MDKFPDSVPRLWPTRSAKDSIRDDPRRIFPVTILVCVRRPCFLINNVWGMRECMLPRQNKKKTASC